ncbi:MAG: molybdopterin cofactor-binding domain-containing protein, partial [Allosphingosinicella sp.]
MSIKATRQNGKYEAIKVWRLSLGATITPRMATGDQAAKAAADGKGISRRSLLIGGGAGAGLIVAWSLWPRNYAPNLRSAPGETLFNAFLKIGNDGRVIVAVPQAELGQGVYTTLPQILADELGADWRTVSVEAAPISPLYANALVAEQSADDSFTAFFNGVARWTAREYATRGALMF